MTTHGLQVSSGGGGGGDGTSLSGEERGKKLLSEVGGRHLTKSAVGPGTMCGVRINVGIVHMSVRD